VTATERAYARFVPREFLELLRVPRITDVQLGTQVEREMTILFSDIRDFTTISESMTPQENFAFLNRYLSVMEPIVEAHGGVVDKFIGDAIMALFPHSADDAVACGVAMMAQLQVYNATRAQAGEAPIRIGIGLNTGLVMLGTIGGRDRMDTTVIGDSVNLASRIEGITKTYRTPFVVGEQTLYALERPEKWAHRFLDRLHVKGKRHAQSVYEIFEIDAQPLRDQKQRTQPQYEEALAYAQLGDVARALPLLEQCLAEAPDDQAAATYLARCQQAARSGGASSTGELLVSLDWTRDFEVGHEVIDSQHLELVQHINALAQGVQAERPGELKELLAFLGQYVAMHFRTEEQLMGRYHYPFAAEHVRQHRRFNDYYLHLQREIASGHHAPLYLAFRIQLHLMDWLVTHSTGTDRHLARFVRAAEAEEAEAAA
jgi:hemerythrin